MEQRENHKTEFEHIFHLKTGFKVKEVVDCVNSLN